MDLYQIFTYRAKYQCKSACLIYPKISGIENSSFELPYFYKAFEENLQEPKKELHIAFFDISDKNESKNTKEFIKILHNKQQS